MFKKNNFKVFTDFLPYLKEVMQKDIMASVTDLDKFIAYAPGDDIDVKIKLGSPIPENDPLRATIASNQIITAVVPKEVYGVPFRAVTYPIRDKDGKCIGAVGIAESMVRESQIAEDVNLIIKDIAQVNNELVLTTDSVADMSSSIQEIAATGEEVNASVDSIVNQSTTIYSMVEEASAASQSVITEAQAGIHKINGVNDTIEELSKEILSIKDQIETLNTSIDEAYQMINLINNISNQTNLLALNASIEAARAGEHGRGFAVVADEVGKLAVQSQEASTEISDIMKKIQDEITSVVDKVNITAKSTENNIDNINAATTNINSILTDINGIDSAISSVRNTVENQVSSSMEVNESMSNFTSVIENIASNSSSISNDLDQNMQRLSLFEEKLNQTADVIVRK